MKDIAMARKKPPTHKIQKTPNKTQIKILNQPIK